MRFVFLIFVIIFTSVAAVAQANTQIDFARRLHFSGDTLSASIRVQNPTTETVPAVSYVVLEVGGTFFFGPSWTETPKAYFGGDLPPGFDSGDINVLDIPLTVSIPFRVPLALHAATIDLRTADLFGDLATEYIELTPGRSWRVAPQQPRDFATITEAIQAASQGDTVVVADGNYTWQNGETIPVVLKPGIHVRGEDPDNPPRIVAPPVVLVRSLRPPGYIRPGMLALDLNVSTIVSDLHFYGGMGFETQRIGYRRRGGTFYAENSFLEIRSCVFENGYAFDGGGAAIVDSEVKIINSTFQDNWLDYGSLSAFDRVVEMDSCRGGGLFIEGGKAAIEGSSFLRNISAEQSESPVDSVKMAWGGGLAFRSADVVASDLLISENESEEGAGFFSEESDVTISISSIVANKALKAGSAFAQQNGNVRIFSSDVKENGPYQSFNTRTDLQILMHSIGGRLELYQVEVMRNTLQSTLYIALLSHIGGDSLIVNQTVFKDNHLESSTVPPNYTLISSSDRVVLTNTQALDVDFGGIGGGSRHIDQKMLLAIDNSIFVNQVWLRDNIDFSITHSVIGAITSASPDGSIGSISNSIIRRVNHLKNEPGVTFRHCLFEDASALSGTSSISGDASFMDSSFHNYSLGPSSPAIDAGIMTSDTPSTDIDGRPRPNPSTNIPDIGPYEWY